MLYNLYNKYMQIRHRPIVASVTTNIKHVARFVRQWCLMIDATLIKCKTIPIYSIIIFCLNTFTLWTFIL